MGPAKAPWAGRCSLSAISSGTTPTSRPANASLRCYPSSSPSAASAQRHTEGSVGIDAIPAYNMTEGRTQFHPQGRDNGYVVTVDGKRVYISGDTEDIPEMRALTDIDIAFVCMNLPFTMDANQAASAVTEFAPSVVYPYHYRGRDDGTQDPAEFARLLSEAGGKAEVVVGPWYG